MTSPGLQRRLGLGDAVWIGLGSMIGAGVFSVFAPAARAAGSGLLVGLDLAAVVAWCNATSTAQLAVAHPRAGGAYLYGREVLGPWAGFVAGWGFVVGKTASCAAMALTVASYVAPGDERAVAAAVVVALTVVNCLGVTRTALATKVIVVVVLLGLAVVVVAAWGSGEPQPFADWSVTGGPYGVLQAAGLLFFAFAGYARIATLAEEVRDPDRVIPRAVTLALTGAVLLYAVVALLCLGVLGADALAQSTAPVADTVEVAGVSGLLPVVRVVAALAAAGALLALGAGIGRTALAMAREGDLPRQLAAVHPRFATPARAEVLVGAVVVALVLTTDLRGAIGFSSFGVLTYYLVANAAAYRQPEEQRLYPRAAPALGGLGCAVLAFSLPVSAVLTGLGVVAAGLVYRALSHRPTLAP